MNKKIGMVSLGCSKNQVDAELMLSLLGKRGYEINTDPSQCDGIIINTCGFIEDAKRESIDNILNYCGMKANGKLKVVAVTGCLAERYKEEVAKEIPEADVVIGIGKNIDIADVLDKAFEGEKVVQFAEKDALSMEGERILANPNYYAYIKVADGCDNRCSYCAIPLIRGGFRSRKFENIIEEVKTLAERGVKEFNLIAQDTTRYGEDLYGEIRLPELIERICEIEKVQWVRILYCYPERITDELLDMMAQQEKVVKYMDIPVQHASGKVLKQMNRRGDAKSLTELMEKIRRKMPEIALRTTIITGFPDENEEDFETLCEFVENVKFDRLGAFAYSAEEDTPAFDMENQIDEDIKKHRKDIIMSMQYGIAEAKAASCIGKTLTVLTESYDASNNMYIGRSYMDAPDIDTKVYFSSEKDVQAGEFIEVLITLADEYDLVGESTGRSE